MQNNQQIEVITRENPIKLNVVTVQINPEYKNIKANMLKCDKFLSQYSVNDKLDFVLFPEMAFLGYNFESSEDISPYTEEQGKGQIFEYVSNLAKKLNTYVSIGYGEQTSEKKFYNAAYLIDREGKLIKNFRKKHLYQTDKSWAIEGESFESIELTNSEKIKFKMSLGICMDLNPWEFKEYYAYEWANYLKQAEPDVVIFLQNWNDSEPGVNTQESIINSLNYFINRLNPIVNTKKQIKYPKSFVLLICNRVGSEPNVFYNKPPHDFTTKEKTCHYQGGSCALQFNPLLLYKNQDKIEESSLLNNIILK